MEEILKKLVESELLTESTRSEILEKLNEAIEEKVADRLSVSVKAEKVKLKEAFDSERKSLVESIDSFIKENLEGAFGDQLREEYRTKFTEERKGLIESVSAFLDERLKGMKPTKQNKQNAVHEAFYKMVKQIVVSEQELDDKIASAFTKLQESLQRKDAKINKLYGRLVEANSRTDGVVLEGKIDKVLNLIAESKRPLAKRLFEGVTLDKFDSISKQVMAELVESDEGDKTIQETGHSGKEVVVESVVESKSSYDEMARNKKLAGI